MRNIWNSFKTNKTKAVALIIVIIVIISLIIFYNRSNENLEKTNLTIINERGEEIKITVEIADSNTERSEGLSNRDELEEDRGMLFVYDRDVDYGFWMKDTYIPLSIAFIDKDGKIIDVQKMEPETTDSHKPDSLYRYALEVNQGFFEDNDIVVGNTVLIPET